LNSINDGISFHAPLLHDEKVPDNWREVNVVPLFEGEDRDTSGYRPIRRPVRRVKLSSPIVRDKITELLVRFEVIRKTHSTDLDRKNHVSQICFCNLFLDRVPRRVNEGVSMDVVFTARQHSLLGRALY